MAERPAVLFVCVHSAARSQMAAGFLRNMAGDRIDVVSAGSEPARDVNPTVVAAVAEKGIDLSGARPALISDLAVRAAEVVVTMGCGDACPYFPGKRYEDWPVEDPAGKAPEEIRPDPRRDRASRRGLLREILRESEV